MGAACVEDFGVSQLTRSFETPSFSALSATVARRDGFSKGQPCSIPDFHGPETARTRGAECLCPRHFHLLSDQDLDDLRPIAATILQQRSEIVRDWYQQYAIHFGDSRTFSQHDFARIFEAALQAKQSALLNGDIDKYAAEVSRLGELLAARRMPLTEVIASLQLFKNSVRTFAQGQTGGLATAFDKLSHVQIILLVSAYFRSEAAAAGERVAALEREAAHLPAGEKAHFHGLVGATAAMRQLYQRIEAAAAIKGKSEHLEQP